MTMIRFQCEVTDASEMEQIAQLIEERLSKLDVVEKVKAQPEEEARTGLEVAAAIGVTVLIIRGTRQGVAELRKLIVELRKLLKEIEGLYGDAKGIFVEVGKERIPLDEVGEKEIQELEAAS